MTAAATRARDASYALATATRERKDAALRAMAGALEEACDDVLRANDEDVTRAEQAGTPANIVDRLRLTPERVAGMAEGLRDVAALPDPIGEVVGATRCPTASSCARCACRSAWSR